MIKQILVGFLRMKMWKLFRRFDPTGVENIPEVCPTWLVNEKHYSGGLPPPGEMWIPTMDLSSLKL
jgi:hypothetical protein